VSVLDELGLSEADLGALARDEPERPARRRSPPGGTDREVPLGARRRETGSRQRCPACGFAQSGDPSSCRRWGNRLREPRRETRVAAVLGEERDVLADLGLNEDDLRGSLDPAPRRPPGDGGGTGGDRLARTRVRELADWAAALREGGRSSGETAEIIRQSGHGEAEVDEALRLAEARIAGGDPADDDDRSDLPPLSEGLDGFLAPRVGGAA
jgi:hypothetical protein